MFTRKMATNNKTQMALRRFFSQKCFLLKFSLSVAYATLTQFKKKSVC